VNVVDDTLAKVADYSTRTGVFDAVTLGQIFEAAYDVDRSGTDLLERIGRRRSHRGAFAA
jgi:hypothetical protein